MRNALTIARRDFTAALASPVAFVLFGVFAFLFGYFFSDFLANFVEAGMRTAQMGGFSGGDLHVNHDLIRWLLASAAILVLFFAPLLSMRAISEEVRAGTLELLLTAPVTDTQIVLGKFLGAFALYLVMLGFTLFHLAVLFWFSQPDPGPVLAAYLGLTLFGAAVLALGLFFSSLTRSQIVAGLLSLGALLVLWLVEFADQGGGGARAALAYVSVTGHMSDFARGVIATRDIVFYLTFAGFWLFLTRESIRSRRWRG